MTTPRNEEYVARKIKTPVSLNRGARPSCSADAPPIPQDSRRYDNGLADHQRERLAELAVRYQPALFAAMVRLITLVETHATEHGVTPESAGAILEARELMTAARRLD